MAPPRGPRNQDEQPDTSHSEPDGAKQASPRADGAGYGKPPVATRFVKGQSGNPRGRPRKPKTPPFRLSDAPFEMFLAEEAYRAVTVRENGKTFQLPLLQATLRAMSMAALKGNRLSQQYLLEHVAAAEERHLQLKVENYEHLAALKREREKLIADHKRKHLPPPELLPHPDDIVLKPATGEAFVNGPRTPEEAHHCDETLALRDHLILLAAHAEKIGRGPKVRHGEGTCCMYLVFACLLDSCLPRRLRWPEDRAGWLMQEHESLLRRERERRIAAEFAHLREIRLEPLYMTPEMDRQLKQLKDRWLKQQRSRQSHCS